MKNSFRFMTFALISLGLSSGTARAQPATDVVTFTGMCDASGAVPVGPHQFVVADDEDNILRVYDATRGGPPLHALDVSMDLPLRKTPGPKRVVRADGALKKPKRAPESDLEAATRLEGHAYWLTSHGRNSSGKMHPARFILFATTIPRPGEPAGVLGRPYTGLLEDLIAAEALRPFDLGAAAARAPKEVGGFNVEGLTAMPDGKGMYIGFRNPIPKGRALLVPLENPREVMAGARARLGAPVLLDLGGQGIRSLSWWRGQYLIAAGHHAEGGISRLFTWDGRGVPRALNIDLRGFNVEAFFTPEERDRILVFSDDGGADIGGTPCKELKDVSQKRFRGRWLTIPPAAPTSASAQRLGLGGSVARVPEATAPGFRVDDLARAPSAGAVR